MRKRGLVHGDQRPREAPADELRRTPVDNSIASATPTISVIDMPSAATWISLIVRYAITAISTAAIRRRTPAQWRTRSGCQKTPGSACPSTVSPANTRSHQFGIQRIDDHRDFPIALRVLFPVGDEFIAIRFQHHKVVALALFKKQRIQRWDPPAAEYSAMNCACSESSASASLVIESTLSAKETTPGHHHHKQAQKHIAREQFAEDPHRAPAQQARFNPLPAFQSGTLFPKTVLISQRLPGLHSFGADALDVAVPPRACPPGKS